MSTGCNTDEAREYTRIYYASVLGLWCKAICKEVQCCASGFGDVNTTYPDGVGECVLYIQLPVTWEPLKCGSRTQTSHDADLWNLGMWIQRIQMVLVSVYYISNLRVTGMRITNSDITRCRLVEFGNVNKTYPHGVGVFVLSSNVHKDLTWHIESCVDSWKCCVSPPHITNSQTRVSRSQTVWRYCVYRLMELLPVSSI